ncbi:MAG: hypothetical protein ACFFF4_00885, partial [Candidatus Thorarchaeota archaeon]
MEPLGTITMYYQFLDKEIVDILDRIMQEAETYDDFAEKLVDYVCTEEVSNMFGVIAGIHAGIVGSHDLFMRLMPKFGEITLVKALRDGVTEGGEWLELALAENHEDWIKTTLYYMRSWMYDRIPIQEVSKYLDLGMELIDKNPKLECFRSYFL